ncbi:hypothetical protein D3C84_1018750 [compost metagenome]
MPLERRQQLLLGLGAAHEDEARRTAVVAGRALLEGVVELAQQRVRHRLVEPGIVRAGL